MYNIQEFIHITPTLFFPLLFYFFIFPEWASFLIYFFSSIVWLAWPYPNKSWLYWPLFFIYSLSLTSCSAGCTKNKNKYIYRKKEQKKRRKRTCVAGWPLINGDHLMLERNKRSRWSTRTCQALLSECNLVQRYIVGWLSILLGASDWNHSSAPCYSRYRQKALQTLLEMYDAFQCPCWLAEMAIFKTDVRILDA